MKLKLEEIASVHPELAWLWDLTCDTHYLLRACRDIHNDHMQVIMKIEPITVLKLKGKHYVTGGFRTYALARLILDPATTIDVLTENSDFFDANLVANSVYFSHLIYLAPQKEILHFINIISKKIPINPLKKNLEILGLTANQIKKRKIKPSQLQIEFDKIKLLKE